MANNNLWPELEAAERDDPVPLWMISFCDLVSLVLATFVLLFSMRELELNEWDKVRGSMHGIFPTVTDTGEGTPPKQMTESAQLVGRKGSILPYLMQVWKQKMLDQPLWDKAQVTYAREAGELWMEWPEGANSQPAVDILQKWRNRVRIVVNSPQEMEAGLAYLRRLTQAGVVVAKEIRMTPGVAAGVWLVVEDKQ